MPSSTPFPYFNIIERSNKKITTEQTIFINDFRFYALDYINKSSEWSRNNIGKE